ncbi:MAG: DUF5611 family protein [Thermoplasmatales archaeon]|nr:DUF5611 family protein [Thermoplasmatales archaeon]
MDYDIKRGHSKNIEGDALAKLMEEIFGNVREEGGDLVSKYGVMSRIAVRQVSNTVLSLETESKDASEVSDDEILESKRKLNAFLEKATGFNAKQRMKRAQDKVKKGVE